MIKNNRILIIGAGISGLTLARLFKDSGNEVEIREKEEFIGGLASDDKVEDFYVSKFGPRFLRFTKDTQDAKNFIEKHTKLIKYNHKVVALGNGNFTMWPPNKTYSDLFKTLNPNRSMVDEFIWSYTRKMWGSEYKEVLGNIQSRFKIKDNYNTDFFEGRQGYMPNKGFCGLFKELSREITIVNDKAENIDTIYKDVDNYDLIFVSGPIDEFFKFQFGRLEYKAMKFEFKPMENDGSNILLSTVMNLNTHPKVMRITEYNQFYNSHSTTRIVGIEKRTKDGVQCYPVMTKKNLDRLAQYQEYAKHFDSIYFIGRLGTYKYLDFDQSCQESLNLFNRISKK